MESLQDVLETRDFWETEITNFADFVWAGSSLFLKLSTYALGGAALYLPVYIVLVYMISMQFVGKRSLDMLMPRQISSWANESVLLPRMLMEAQEDVAREELTRLAGSRSEALNKSLYTEVSHSPTSRKSGNFVYRGGGDGMGLLELAFELWLPFIFTFGTLALSFSVYLASLVLYVVLVYGILPLYRMRRRSTLIGTHTSSNSAIWRQRNDTEGDAQAVALTARILRAVEVQQWRSKGGF